MKSSKNATIISFINMKGGVGKTNTTKEIGYYLATNENKKILFIDIDPQANLTQSFFKKFNYVQKELEELVEGKLSDLDEIIDEESNQNYVVNSPLSNIKNKKETTASIHKLFKPGKINHLKKSDCIVELSENIHLIPGTLEAVFLERSNSIENNLYNYIKNLNLRDEYDYIFIDCPPTYSNYTIAALISSDFYLTPAKADAYSILGIKMLHDVVQQIKEIHSVYFESKQLNSLGVILTNTQPSNKGIETNKNLIKSSKKLKELNIKFFDTEFSFNPSIPKKAEYFIVDSNSDISKDQLTVLVEEFIRKVEAYGGY